MTWRGMKPGEVSTFDLFIRPAIALIFGAESAYPAKAGTAISAAILETQSSTRETTR